MKAITFREYLKIKYLLSETLEKPKTHNDKNYNKWQQYIKDFELLKK
jgi:hypothetical protein